MSDVFRCLFESNTYDANLEGNSLVYLALPDDSDLLDRVCDAVPGQTMMAHLANYHCSQINSGTAEFVAFIEQYPQATVPSFNIINKNIQRMFAAEDAPAQFSAFLEKNNLDFPSPEVNGKDSYKSDEKVLINSKVQISIRLPSGATVKGTFDAGRTLKHVGRWLEREHNVLLASEKDYATVYRSDLPEPVRYAFFCPGTRVTFCESQEFCQLNTLGLAPRLVLILKPEYDTRALEAHANYSTFSAAQAKLTSMLQALYSFFDYGVDDAQRDLQSITKDEPVTAPAFLSMDATNNSSSRIMVSPMPLENDVQPEILAETVSREGTPAPARLDVLV